MCHDGRARAVTGACDAGSGTEADARAWGPGSVPGIAGNEAVDGEKEEFATTMASSWTDCRVSDVMVSRVWLSRDGSEVNVAMIGACASAAAFRACCSSGRCSGPWRACSWCTILHTFSWKQYILGQ